VIAVIVHSGTLDHAPVRVGGDHPDGAPRSLRRRLRLPPASERSPGRSRLGGRAAGTLLR
jgi:hypothetical protein